MASTSHAGVSPGGRGAAPTWLGAAALAWIPLLLLADLGLAVGRGWFTSSDLPDVVAGVCGVWLVVTVALAATARGRRLLRAHGVGLAVATGATAASWLAAEWVLARTPFADSLFHRYVPGTEATIPIDPEVMPGVEGPAHFRANALGLRGPDAPAADDGGARRLDVLCIGGSTTICLSLDADETWPRLLERQLAARGDAPVHVANAGKSGYGTWHHVRLLEDRALLERFDTAVFLVGINDLMRALSGKPLRAPFGVRPLFERSVLVTAVRNVLQARRQRKEHRDEARMSETLPERRANRARAVAAGAVRDDLPDLRASLDGYAANLRTIVRACRAVGVEPVFVTQPTLWRKDLEPDLRALLWLGSLPDGRVASPGALAAGMRAFNDRLRQVCAGEQVRCIDAAARMDGDGALFFDSCHFTERGARVLAGLVADGWTRRTD